MTQHIDLTDRTSHDRCADAAEQGIDRDWVCGGAEKGCIICKANAEEDGEDDPGEPVDEEERLDHDHSMDG